MATTRLGVHMSSTRHVVRRAGAIGVAGLVSVAGVMAQAPSPALLVMLRVNKSNGTMAVVDPSTRKIVTRVRTGEDPHGVAVSANGKLAFVVNTSGEDGESLSVIDVAAGKETRRLQLKGSRPHDVHVAGSVAFFTAGGKKAIGRYDPAKDHIDWLSTGAHTTRMMTIDERTNTIYATSQSTKTVVMLQNIFGSESEWKLTEIALGQEGEGITHSPDGQEIWTANRDGSGVSIVDVASKRIRTIPVQTDHANRLAFTPDGKQVLLLDREIGVTIIMDGVNKKEIKRIKHSGSSEADLVGIGDVVMAADGLRAFITVQNVGDEGPRSEARPVAAGPHYVAIIDLKTLEVTGRIATDIPGDEMAWAQPSK